MPKNGCIVQNVSSITAYYPDWKTWQLSTRYRAYQGDFCAWHSWHKYGVWCSRV